MRDEMAQGANAESARESAKSVVSPIGTLEYLDAVDAETFEPLERLRAPAFVVGALRFGTTRLLDNIWVRE
jgi:pantothenate synthetase